MQTYEDERVIAAGNLRYCSESDSGRSHHIAECCGSMVVYTWEDFCNCNKGIVVFITQEVHDLINDDVSKMFKLLLDNGDIVYIKEAIDIDEDFSYGYNRDLVLARPAAEDTPYCSIYLYYVARWNNSYPEYVKYLEHWKKTYKYFFFITTPEMYTSEYQYTQKYIDYFGKTIYESKEFAVNNNTEEPGRLKLIIVRKEDE